jgi:hypothetical protein
VHHLEGMLDTDCWVSASQFRIQKVWGNIKVCFSSKFLDVDVDAASPRLALGELLQ